MGYVDQFQAKGDFQVYSETCLFGRIDETHTVQIVYTSVTGTLFHHSIYLNRYKHTKKEPPRYGTVQQMQLEHTEYSTHSTQW